MRLVDVLRSLSPVFLAVLAPILVSRRRLIRSFERAGATSPASAITVQLGGPLGRWWLSRLTRLRVLGSTPDGSHWVDLHALAAYRSVRRRRAVTIFIVILLSMTLLAVLSRGE